MPVLLLSLYVAPSSRAQSRQSETNDWQFVAPIYYVWLFQVNGNISVKGTTHNVDLSISDVLQDSYGIQMYVEADKGNWGGFVEPTYMSFSTERKFSGVQYKNRAEVLFFDSGVTYQVWHSNDSKAMSLCALAGARYWNYDIQANGKGPAPNGSAHLDIIDPVIGARFRMHVTEKLLFGTRFDVGGFGITDMESHFTWQSVTLLNFDVTKRFSVFGGYRAFGLNYDANSGSQH